MMIGTTMTREQRDELAELDRVYNGPPDTAALLLARPRRGLMDLAARLLEEEAEREASRPELAGALHDAARSLARAVAVLDGLEPLPGSGGACFEECKAARAARTVAAQGGTR